MTDLEPQPERVMQRPAPAWILWLRKIHEVMGELSSSVQLLHRKKLKKKCVILVVWLCENESSGSGEPQGGVWRGDVCGSLHDTLVEGRRGQRGQPRQGVTGRQRNSESAPLRGSCPPPTCPCRRACGRRDGGAGRGEKQSGAIR